MEDTILLPQIPREGGRCKSAEASREAECQRARCLPVPGTAGNPTVTKGQVSPATHTAGHPTVTEDLACPPLHSWTLTVRGPCVSPSPALIDTHSNKGSTVHHPMHS